MGRVALGAPALLLGLASLALVALQQAPRPGHPVLLVFPPGLGDGAALAGLLGAPGWRPVGLHRIGPLSLGIAAPAEPGASAEALRRRSGAWLALLAGGPLGCAALPGRAG